MEKYESAQFLEMTMRILKDESLLETQRIFKRKSRENSLKRILSRKLYVISLRSS